MKKRYYLFNPGRMSRKDNTLKFTPVNEKGEEQKPRYLPIEQVDELFAFGSLDANSSLYNFLGKNQVAVHFFDYYENYTGSFTPKDTLLSGKSLIKQVNYHNNKKKRIWLAQKILLGASYNMLKNLKYYNNRGKNLDEIIYKIEDYISLMSNTKAIDELMGLEGNIRKSYYQAFSEILSNFDFEGRQYRPPDNEVNALISFGNMMCYSECLRSINQTQLNPTISYLHSPGDRRYSLALDIAEIFKPILVDRLIFKVINKNEIQKKDFDQHVNRIVLKDSGRKKFVQSWENKLSETIQHRKLKRSVSYKHLIKLECYKIMKEILGIEEYKPLKMWW